MRRMADWYSRPSFFRSMGSVLDVFGVFSEYSMASDDQQADARALYSDFEAVGVDLAKAISQYESEQKSRRRKRVPRPDPQPGPAVTQEISQQVEVSVGLFRPAILKAYNEAILTLLTAFSAWQKNRVNIDGGPRRR